MKEFLKDMLIEPFTEGDWLGYILGGLMWILTIAIVGGLLWLSVWLIDSSFLPIKEKEGTITNKYIIPAHTTTTYIMSGKVMIPITSYISTSYDVEITIDGITDDVCLNQGYWNTVEVGQKLCCQYTNGRILKSLYIKSFCGGKNNY